MAYILTVDNLSKTYKNGRKALDHLTFNVRKGEILGFLGPNGAGKSTTINMLATLLKADEGKIVYFNNENLSLKAIKKKLGIVPQELAIYEDLSAFDNVKFFASLYGIKKAGLKEKVDQALKKVGLEERKDDKASTFSGGMKRRLNIACAIAHEPQLIILDEPTVGIDPQSRNHILHSIKSLRDEGATIIYTTHYMEEVQQICDRVIIMDGGQVLLNDQLDAILETYSETNYQLSLDQPLPLELLDQIRQFPHILQLSQDDDYQLNIMMEAGTSLLNEILELIIQSHVNITGIQSRKKNLEDIFLLLTGKKLRD
ncbi:MULTISPECIES: ABC transporter ATP-binding protein [Aerococcus]|uniref:ABC transporter ATP-binding protein n=1 Tax=Aerococcus urinae (strain CCUG 59500 / ACS-120-V-Col10a) TaxID=2976812 RepID=UPI000200E7FA|nr:ABC transporter ATP-binding protein [Aerococcus sp. Group 1]AEA00567.1 ABC transporter, ATP-binding protein [Aerococcus sp. Group 1]MCY3030345.1 ABC transporter ATP-binding protein [Aerococcus sp. Group 1]MCY3055442.1 ABC transporter ATP-binding protein [Aerococcus sp. Group 1]MCY3057172.1 ABC transporter ATP-binding protein [Aerococcus sp. Group 1]MCY3061785.1 ABC transporter ATP-binding protein [Aerococcus sp. Group 1]